MKNRNLKVQPNRKAIGYAGFRKSITTSKLRLAGKWLKEAGFLPNTEVSVNVQKGKLVIVPTINSNTSN